MLYQDEKMEMDSLVGWLERRMDTTEPMSLSLYVTKFKEMWVQSFGNLDNVPIELIKEVNARYMQLVRR